MVALGLGILLPTTYDSFLWNRLRYLWPFAGPWLIGLVALADQLGELAALLKARLGLLRYGVNFFVLEKFARVVHMTNLEVYARMRGESFEDYLRWADLRVRALNHALEGIPEDRVRYHVCWGSWHGPHAFDPPLRDVVDLVLSVNAGYYSIEQANARRVALELAALERVDGGDLDHYAASVCDATQASQHALASARTRPI